MLFHRSGQVAVQAALLLALEGSAEPRRVRELGPQLGVSPAYLSKVLQQLSRAGVLRSLRGPAGGFQLARPAQEISLWHVLAAVEPLGQLDACLLGLGRCNGQLSCPLHKDWVVIRDHIVALLQTRSLSDIALEARQKHCCRFSLTAPPANPSSTEFPRESR